MPPTDYGCEEIGPTFMTDANDPTTDESDYLLISITAAVSGVLLVITATIVLGFVVAYFCKWYSHDLQVILAQTWCLVLVSRTFTVYQCRKH